MGFHDCLQGPHVYKLGLVMDQNIDIIAIYCCRWYYRTFPGPTATCCCSCYNIVYITCTLTRYLYVYRANIHHLNRTNIRRLSLAYIQDIRPPSQQAIRQHRALPVAIRQPMFPEVIRQDPEWVTHPTLRLPATPQGQCQVVEAIPQGAIHQLSRVDIHLLSSLDILDHIRHQVAPTVVDHRHRIFHVNIVMLVN